MQIDSDQDSDYFNPAALYLRVFVVVNDSPKELTHVTKVNIKTGEYWQYKTDANGNIFMDDYRTLAMVEHHKDDTLWIEFQDDTPIAVINFMMKQMRTLCN